MSDNSKDVVIVEAVRTPIGTYNGSLKDIRAHQLGSIVINEILKRSNVNPNEVDEIIMGQVLTAGMGQNPARQAAINAGIHVSKPAYIVNQVCGSGLRAIISGFQSIKLGDSKIVISGGQENMSIAPQIALKENEKKNSENKFLDVMKFVFPISFSLISAIHCKPQLFAVLLMFRICFLSNCKRR